LVGVTVKFALPAACVTVTVWPPRVAVATRAPALVVVFAAAVSVTLPAPVPPAVLSVSHDWLLLVVQATVAGLTPTATVCVPPVPETLHAVGVMVTVPAVCVTVTARPPMVTVAVRTAALVVGAAVMLTVPLPVPPAGLTVTHG
jgi:hypothetical protein